MPWPACRSTLSYFVAGKMALTVCAYSPLSLSYVVISESNEFTSICGPYERPASASTPC